jgi:hypothetical protein
MSIVRLLSIVTLLCAVLLTSGCGRALVTTTVDSSGGYSRNLKLSAAASSGGMTTGPSLNQSFTLPAGAAWTTTLAKTKQGDTYTAARRFEAGNADTKDLVVITGKDASVENAATVTQVSPGVWEYREVLHWNGPVKPGETPLDSDEELGEIKKALPPEFATDANATALTKSVLPGLIGSFFGPPRPLLFDMIGNQDLAGKLLEIDVYKTVDAALQKQFGDRMTAVQRTQVVHKLVEMATVKLNSDAQAKSGMGSDAGSPPGGGSDADDGSLASLTFVLRPPGKVISTNGIYNEYTGEVFWGLYPVAASFGDVVLTADYEAPSKAAAIRPARHVYVASASQH